MWSTLLAADNRCRSSFDRRRFVGIVTSLFGERYALSGDSLERGRDTRVSRKYIFLKKKIAERKERLANLLNTLLQLLHPGLQIIDRAFLSPAISLLCDAKLLATSLDTMSGCACEFLVSYLRLESLDRL